MKILEAYLKKQKTRIKNGKIYCKKRKKWIDCTLYSEEVVRQAFLEYLINDIKAPLEYIYVEEPLKHWDIDKKYRADIIVSYYDEKDNLEYPLVLIECKETKVDIKTAIYQVQQYQKELGSVYVVATNGISTIEILEDNEPKVIHHLPSYEELCKNKKIKGKIQAQEQPIPPQIPFPTKIYTRYKKHLFGEQIKEKFYDPIIALDQFLRFTLNHEIIRDDNEDPKIDKRTISVGETRYDYLGNASGGKFNNMYRIFYYKEREFLLSLSTISNESNSGNSTILICGIGHSPILQLNFNRYIDKLDTNQFLLWHNGANGFTASKTIFDETRQRLPYLIKNDRIELGKIDITQKLEWKTMKPIIKNILDYVLLRKCVKENKNHYTRDF